MSRVLTVLAEDDCAYLRANYSYDPTTGEITHLRLNRCTGTPNSKGYIGVSVVLPIVGKRVLKAHHLAWLLQYGSWPTREIDHDDRDRSNNAVGNLRLATVSQNRGNSRKQSNCSSKYKGVFWDTHRSRWVAQLNRRRLGAFDDEVEAARAYNEAAKIHYGEFALLNEV